MQPFNTATGASLLGFAYIGFLVLLLRIVYLFTVWECTYSDIRFIGILSILSYILWRISRHFEKEASCKR